jgi:hypothetical protein
MRTNGPRHGRWVGGLVLLAIGLLPEVASAQASALFPNIYVKRHRPCCASEDPRHRVIREQYFGYYPTCWRRFAPGWGCPSADAPDWAAALRKLPLETGGAGMDTGAGGIDPFAEPGPMPGEELPALPEERPVFPGAEPNRLREDDPFRTLPNRNPDGTSSRPTARRIGPQGPGLPLTPPSDVTARAPDGEIAPLLPPSMTDPGPLPEAAPPALPVPLGRAEPGTRRGPIAQTIARLRGR